MYNFKIFVFNIKKSLIPFFIYLFIIFLLLFSNTNISSSKVGLSIWANSIVPSLLPFFIATELLGYTNIINIFGKFLNKFMRPLFNVPGEGAFPFIMGIITGYPTGAKIVSNLKSQGICTSIESERLIAFTNNSGPIFIIGTVGIGLFNNTNIGILLFITHVLACITVGIIFRFWKCSKRFETQKHNIYSSTPPISMSNLGEILSVSIMNAVKSIVLIGGFIILFSVIISMLKSTKFLYYISYLIHPLLNIFKVPVEFSDGIFSGFLELTNGLFTIATIPNKLISTNITICALLLGFGGFSIVLQILSITSNCKISLKPYLIGKLLQGVFASIYTHIFIYTFPFFNFNL